jgi:MFS transporter, Spinster family, sphingosine-1-phosphate transporter
MKNSTETAVPEHSHADDALSFRPSSRISLDSTHSWYALGILTLSYTLSYIDRQLINLLVDPISRSLMITDTQFSLIQGISFISAYLLAAPMFGRLVDITNRRNILVVGICMWCIFTALCGRADTYLGLFVARLGVGASEACISPIGYSMICDLFSARRAPRAMSIFLLGPMLGGGFSLLASGLVIAFATNVRAQLPVLNSLATWQLAFVVIGLTGILLAVIALLTVREPARSQIFKSTLDDRHYTVREAGAFLWQRRGFYGRLYLGVGMFGMVFLGMPAWLPSFLTRFHGMAPAAVGFRFGLLVITVSAAGVLIGPWVAKLAEKRGYEDAALRTAACSMIGMLLFCAAIPFAPGTVGALVVSAAAIFFFSLPLGPMAAAMQLSAPSRMRGAVGALYTFFAQLIGFGLGPTSIALVTDKVFHDPKMLGYSIAIVCTIASAIAAWLMSSALPYYRRMLDEERVARAA